MQPSRSLGAMHTRRLHGRSASSQVSTSSLPDFGTNYNLDHEPDQAGMGTSLLKRAQSQIDGTATKGASLGWAGKAGSASGPLRTGSLSTIAILLKWRWTWSRISIATYVVFSVILFSWSLIYSSDPGLSQGMSLCLCRMSIGLLDICHILTSCCMTLQASNLSTNEGYYQGLSPTRVFYKLSLHPLPDL